VTSTLPRAVLLDLDDTILDDSGDTERCWRDACRAHAGELGELDPEALHDAVVRVRDWYWGDPDRHRTGRLDLDAARREIVRMSLAGAGIDAPNLAARIADRYGSEREAGMRLFDDAIETIRWLREGGCRLALLTNGGGPAQRRKVERFALAEWFDAVLIEGELGYGKPDERVYRLALERLGVAPGDAWMAGDHLEWDVAAPQRLGIRGIWIDGRGAGLPPGYPARPHRIVRRLSELREEVRP
jgi:putative hydrolase of the HAD superfamily